MLSFCPLKRDKLYRYLLCTSPFQEFSLDQAKRSFVKTTAASSQSTSKKCSQKKRTTTVILCQKMTTTTPSNLKLVRLNYKKLVPRKVIFARLSNPSYFLNPRSSSLQTTMSAAISSDLSLSANRPNLSMSSKISCLS